MVMTQTRKKQISKYLTGRSNARKSNSKHNSSFAYSWCASYVRATMLDDFEKGFSLFAILISSNMAKIFLFIESLGNGCTPRIRKPKHVGREQDDGRQQYNGSFEKK